jgi:uncharacterized protein YicC (UPF0701 family)
MTDEHKAALAEGRSQGRAVRAYLEAIEGHRPKRGRKRTSDSISKRLDAIEEELQEADALRRLQLTQERINLQHELESAQDTVDLESLEREFIRVAKGYAERKGISYAAFRELGVPASALKQAGISRSS